MLGVFICHIIMRLPYHFPLLPDIARLVYTQGFIFLSGFGLYFSFSKNSSLSNYYKRRFNRLYVPYLLMSFPFLAIIVKMTGQNIVDLAGYLSTASFWVKGNFYGMWYIAVLLLLYLLFPCIYGLMFIPPKYIIIRSLFVIALFVIVVLYINKTNPDYYAMNGQWIKKTIMFPIGMLCGYLCKSNQKSIFFSPKIIIPVVTIFYIIVAQKYSFVFYGFFYEHARSIFGIFTLSTIFYFTKNKTYLNKVNSAFSWLGKYSLELYVLHVLIFKTIDACIDNASASEMAISIVIALFICVPIHNAIDKLLFYFSSK